MNIFDIFIAYVTWGCDGTVTLPLSAVDVNNPVGKLTKSDIQKLVEFLY